MLLLRGTVLRCIACRRQWPARWLLSRQARFPVQTFLNRGRIARFGRSRVFNKNDSRFRSYRDLANHAVMSLAIVNNPAAAVEIHHGGEETMISSRSNDANAYTAACAQLDFTILERYLGLMRSAMKLKHTHANLRSPEFR